MYERCLSEAERVLAAHKEVIVPVKTVWHEVVKHSKRQKFEVPSIADFTTMLEADNRFEFLPAHQSVTETVGLPHDDEDPEELELESLGFFGQDRVKLKRIRFISESDYKEEEREESDILPTADVFRVTSLQRPRTGRSLGAKISAKSQKRKTNSRSYVGKRTIRKSLRRSR